MKIKLILMSLLLIGCGKNGEQGIPGARGLAGEPATSCTLTVINNGGTLITCPDGTQSLIFNGTIITPIQFCKGYTTYPNKFNEVGFCINNSIWAVYSDHGGFLTSIPPGLYSSNGINSSCNFTIKNNCVVEEN